MPYTELPHTADWAIRVTAGDFQDLLVEAARGMYALSGVTLAASPRAERKFMLASMDPESLLVAFLSELLFLEEHEQLAFDQFELTVSENGLEAHMTGAPLAGLTKAIKAVTYHNLHIEQAEGITSAEIVFDV